MRTRGIVAAALAALVASCPGARAVTVDDLPPGGSYRVQAIRIEGAGDLSAGTLRDAMLTKVPPWYQPWKRWRTRVPFNPEVFLTDLERLRTVLREAGYFTATVDYDLEVDDDRVTIVITVAEGPATRVRAVDVVTSDFTPTDAERRALRDTLRLHADDVLTQAAYDASRAALERYFQQAGYAYVRVEKAATVDTASARADVAYTITRGIPAVFGSTVVRGTVAVAERLVTREVQWRAGDPWDPRKVEKTQANVFGLHLFRSVAVKPADPEARTGVVDMAITVAEGPPREVKIGVGYGLEDEVRGQNPLAALRLPRRRPAARLQRQGVVDQAGGRGGVPPTVLPRAAADVRRSAHAGARGGAGLHGRARPFRAPHRAPAAARRPRRPRLQHRVRRHEQRPRRDEGAHRRLRGARDRLERHRAPRAQHRERSPRSPRRERGHAERRAGRRTVGR